MPRVPSKASTCISASFPASHAWPVATIGEICVAHTENSDPRKEPNVSFRYVDIASVDNRRKTITEARRLLGKEAPSRARQVIRTNDILVATTRPNLNAVALVPADLDLAICSTGLCVLRSNGQVEPEYLFAFVQADAFVRSLSDIVKGALYPAVTDGQVRAQKLPLPPLPEQRRTAARLREQLGAVADARTAMQTELDAARGLPAAHLRNLFTGQQAAAWQRLPIGEICDLLPSKSIALAGDTEVRAITSACLTETGFKPVGVKTARMWAADAEESQVRPGEILIARSNTTELVGRVSIYKGEPKGLVASDLTIRLWPRTGVNGSFLASYLSFLYSTGYWRDRAGGASGTMKKITRSQINAETVPLPPPWEQRTVAERVDAELSATFATLSIFEERLDALDHLPAALLREAFNGNL